MKTIRFLPVLLTALLTGCVTGNRQTQEHLNALNFKVGNTLQGNSTSTGVVLQADVVNVKSMNGNLLLALPTAVVDAFTGTDYSSVTDTAIAYVVRLDGTRYQHDQIITVIQGPQSKVRSGDHVYILCTAAYRGYDVRLVPVNNPNNYSKEGMREGFERQDQGKSRLQYSGY